MRDLADVFDAFFASGFKIDLFIDVGSILEAFWLHYGTILAPC